MAATFALVVAGFVAGEHLSNKLRFSVVGLYLLATTMFAVRARHSARMVEDIEEYLSTAGASLFADPLAPMGLLRVALIVAGASLAVYFLIRRPNIGSNEADAE